MLAETNITDEEYCHNHLGCKIVYSQEVGTAAGGAQGGVRLVERE